jgi:putative IMPACT (imprinted ancient) family translation regulator
MSAATLAAPARHQLEAKKSRFLAQAAPVASAAEAMDWIRAGSDPDATHNCWAYRCGGDYRFSDDGEPGGSAGRPILAAIDGQGLDRVAVRVTRWYGGINLGVGGLVRAYGGAAAECLRLAPRQPLVEWVEAELACDFALASTVHALLAAHGAQKLAEGFDPDGLRLRLRLPASSFAVLAERLRDASRGTARLQPLDAPLE